MKKITIKRIIGWLILSQVFPAWFILYTVLIGEIDQWGYLVPYLVGWAVNIAGVIIVLLFKLLWWLLND